MCDQCATGRASPLPSSTPLCPPIPTPQGEGFQSRKNQKLRDRKKSAFQAAELAALGIPEQRRPGTAVSRPDTCRDRRERAASPPFRSRGVRVRDTDRDRQVEPEGSTFNSSHRWGAAPGPRGPPFAGSHGGSRAHVRRAGGGAEEGGTQAQSGWEGGASGAHRLRPPAALPPRAAPRALTHKHTHSHTHFTHTHSFLHPHTLH